MEGGQQQQQPTAAAAAAAATAAAAAAAAAAFCGVLRHSNQPFLYTAAAAGRFRLESRGGGGRRYLCGALADLIP